MTQRSLLWFFKPNVRRCVLPSFQSVMKRKRAHKRAGTKPHSRQKRSYLMKKLLLASILFSMAFAFSSNQAEASIQAFTKFGQKCPKGYRHANVEEAKNACRAPGMQKWYIVRLRGGASLSGSGYGCVIKPRDTRKLGGALCYTTNPALQTTKRTSAK